jgi:hypothetical protein
MAMLHPDCEKYEDRLDGVARIGAVAAIVLAVRSKSGPDLGCNQG